MLWSRLALVLEPLQKKEVKREIKRECHKQGKEFRDNTKSTDLPRAKQGKGMRTRHLTKKAQHMRLEPLIFSSQECKNDSK